MSQFVVFEHFLSLIRSSNLDAFSGLENEIFFQDAGSLAFTALDRGFLRSKGYPVLEPAAGEVVSHASRQGQAAQTIMKENRKEEKTILFGPVGNEKLPLLECLQENVYPALLIGNKIELTDD